MTDAPVTPAAAPATYPGKTLGIVGLVLAFLFALLGLILSIVAFNQSKAAGYKNTPAKVGIILSIIFLVLGIVLAIAIPALTAAACAATPGACTVTTY